MTGIIKAGFVSDANTYVNGIIRTEAETIADAVNITAKFVDSLKKGWHVSDVYVDDNENVHIDVKKSA